MTIFPQLIACSCPASCVCAGCVSLPVQESFKKHIWVKPHVGAALSSPSLPLVSLQGKRLPAYLSADAEEGEVSDDDSADEIEDDFKLKSSNVRIVHSDVMAYTVWRQIHWFNDDDAAVHNQGQLKTAIMGVFFNCWTKGREKKSPASTNGTYILKIIARFHSSNR